MKKAIILTALFLVVISTFAFVPISGNGKVIMTVSVDVKDYNEWKRVFDAGAPVREKAGIKVLNVYRGAENENQVLVIEEAKKLQSAKDFIERLKSKQKSGEILKIETKLYNQQ